MLRLRFETRTTWWLAQMNPLSYGGRPLASRVMVVKPLALGQKLQPHAILIRFDILQNKFVLQLRDWKGKREKLLFYESRYCKNVNVESIDSRGLAADGLPGWLACLAGW